MQPTFILLILTVVIGIYMAWNIGANDVANALGTAVGSKALTITKAIVVAIIFEFVGAFLAGSNVTTTIKQGIVDPTIFSNNPMIFACGMASSLLATAIWLQLSSYKGLPVSTTHGIVGAVLGFGLVAAGSGSLQWSSLLSIVFCWFASPITGGIISFLIFCLIKRFILDAKDPIGSARFIAPALIMITSFGMSLSFLYGSLTKNGFAYYTIIAIAFMLSLVLFSIIWHISHKKAKDKHSRKKQLIEVEKIFASMQIITACFMATAHGSNDVANAIGPAAAIVSIVSSNKIVLNSAVPMWLMALGALGLVVGLATYGRRVIMTVGNNITSITPTRGFSAEFGSAITILFGSYLGVPLSTTQILVGSIIGVGLARGIAALNIQVIKKIMSSWVITIPATAILSALISLLSFKIFIG